MQNKSLDLMKRMGMIEESKDVMSIYYNRPANGHLPQPLNEETINRIIDKHGKNGFIIISANRTDKDKQENKQNTISLIQDIKNSGYSYFPVYGGYKGTDDVIDNYEPSFLVANYNRKCEQNDFIKLKEYAIQWCKKYNQDSVLIKSPNEPPIYVNANGSKVNSNESNTVSINDKTKQAFTALYKKPQGTNRFTYDINFECFCNPNPCTLMEYRIRNENGEIIIQYNKNKLI